MNEDELGILFRQAAEKYPLNTEHPDWNKIVHALDSHESVPVVPFHFSFTCINGMEMESIPALFGKNKSVLRKIK
jgi:hypothetical protein